MTAFIGRKRELKRLQLLLKKRSASLAVIHGRRRVGKSRLIEEFGDSLPCHIITGLPPTKGVTKQVQLDEFCEQVATSFELPKFQVGSWSEAFQFLGRLCGKGRVVLALDEISWIGSKDSRFLAHLKEAWDRHFSKNPELILIVCGSVSSWIEENILSHTGFLGRISLDMKLEELPLKDAVTFWDGQRARVSPQEIFKVLSVTGGVPRYLEELVPELTAEENIRLLCFSKDGLLFREFDQIFSDLFSAQAQTYTTVLQSIADQSKTFQEIGSSTEVQRDATLSHYLKNLREAGFITEDPTWNLRTKATSKLKRYRLSDNYIRFYLSYIKQKRESIEQGQFETVSLSSLPGWDSVMGLQFENLILRNTSLVLETLSINPSDVLRYGPFFQRPTTRTKGCQVDLLIQTKYQSLYLCEIKFSQDKVGMKAGHEMVEKLERISTPKSWSKRSVLIHVNGVTRDLEQSEHFDHLVDFGALIR